MYQTGVYAQLHPEWHLEDSDWKAEQIIKILLPQLDGGGSGGIRIADVGCGVGSVLAGVCGFPSSRSAEGGGDLWGGRGSFVRDGWSADRAKSRRITVVATAIRLMAFLLSSEGLFYL